MRRSAVVDSPGIRQAKADAEAAKEQLDAYQAGLDEVSAAYEENEAAIHASEDAKPQQDDSRQIAQTIEKQIATAKSQDDRLHDLLEQGIYDTDTFLQRHAALNQRIALLEQAKSDLHPKGCLDTPKMVERIQGVLDAYHSLPSQERNILLKTVLEKVIYRKEFGAKPAEFHLTLFLLPIYL